jgi:ATP-dependent Lhr-like helicase
MAHEILNANPYAFLDDAPLEERRARAVSLRRVDPWLDRELGQLDPAAIEEVREQAWPDVRSSDELHDFLLDIGLLPLAQNDEWAVFAETLLRAGRATVASWAAHGEPKPKQAYVAAERWNWIDKILPQAQTIPALNLPGNLSAAVDDEEQVMRKVVQGWIEVLGPTTVGQLSAKLGLAESRVEAAMLALEASGVVLRGQFSGASQETEWCERGLLARIHRLTLGRRRKEIEPVSATEFMKFLISWQHASPTMRLRGRDGVLQVIKQLQGLELPAPAWEQFVLPARIENYDPADLEHLCLAGVVAWGRLRSEIPDLDEPGAEKKRRRNPRRPTRSAPIAFLLREERDYFLDAVTSPQEALSRLSPMARQVADYLATRGASFLSDIARGTGLLKVKAEESLWELVARGMATGDGVAGLRVLLTPDKKRHKRRRLRLIDGGQARERLMPVGRWSLWRTENPADAIGQEQIAEQQARQLLRRYGVVFRELLSRENCAPSWRIVQQIYRRLEARGEIRGGRFVTGFVGEQFALPEAVDRLRAERRLQAAQEPIIVAAADPLNLVGILSAGARLSPYAHQAIAYDNGLAAEVGPLGSLRSKLHRDREKLASQ